LKLFKHQTMSLVRMEQEHFVYFLPISNQCLLSSAVSFSSSRSSNY
jgi:hypothetical protein